MAAQAYRDGVAAYRIASYETAVLLFGQAITLEPTLVKAYDARAGACEKLGQLKRALADSRQVVTLLPDSFKGYLRAGRLWKAAGKLSQAEKLLIQALAKPDVTPAALKDIQVELDTVRALTAKATFCPIATLPLDLFIEIMSLATAPPSMLDWSKDSHAKAPRINAVLAASQVCRSWRQAVGSASKLWSTLSIDGLLDTTRLIEKVAFWSRKSMGRHGDDKGIRVLLVTNASEIQPEIYRDILALLVRDRSCGMLESFGHAWMGNMLGADAKEMAQQAQTFQALTIDFKTSRLATIVLSSPVPLAFNYTFIKLQLLSPSLKTVILLGGAGGRPTTTLFQRGLADLPPVASNIEHLQLSTLRQARIGGCTFPKLKRLHLDKPDIFGVDGEELWGLLSTPKLDELHLTAWRPTSIVVPEVADSFSSLRALSIRSSVELGLRLLNLCVDASVSFQRLTHLDLTGARLHLPHLAQFNSTSAPVLVNLKLAKTTWQLATLQRGTVWLPVMEKLEVLDVSSCAWPDDAFVAQLQTQVPQLLRLNLGSAGKTSLAITGPPLMLWVRSRMAAAPPPLPIEPVTSWSCTTDSLYSPSPPSAVVTLDLPPKLICAIKEMNLNGLAGIDAASVLWLKRHVRPGGVKYRLFLADEEKRQFSLRSM